MIITSLYYNQQSRKNQYLLVIIILFLSFVKIVTKIIAKNIGFKYIELNATNCGTKEISSFLTEQYKNSILFIDEFHLLNRKQGCSCCSGKTVVKGINDIATTNPEIIKYLKEED